MLHLVFERAWSSDLMPVIFLFSAIVSGVALLVVLYVASCKLRKITVDAACVKGLAYTNFLTPEESTMKRTRAAVVVCSAFC